MLLKTNILARIGYSQLPHWAQPEHPVMRAVMGYRQQIQWRRRLIRLLAFVAFLAVAVAAGYLIANSNAGDEDPTILEVLYWPLIGAQIMAMVLGVSMTANVVAIERQRQTWDSLRLSLTGVSLTLRARWIAVFFKLGWLLAAITIGRLVYLAVLLQDMTEFQGRALDLYISGITPEVSLNTSILIMAGLMTAFILQPFVAVGLAAAIGLIVSVFTRTRTVVVLGLLLLIGLRLAITSGGLFVGTTVFEDGGVTTDLFQMETNEAWYRLLLSSAEGDMMLKLMHLETLGQVWADVENTIYIGGVLLLIVLIQAVIANALVLFAAWRATRPTSS